MENKIHILSTASLPTHLLEKAADCNLIIEQLSFIVTEPIESVEVQQEIESTMILPATIVFTSCNAVEAVAVFIDEDILPQWNIYCVGESTRNLAEQYFPSCHFAGIADNAASLAEIIIEESEGEDVIFFCGNQRRDELPDRLRENDILVEEIIVYETYYATHKVSGEYMGILFFSPSAVESFFTLNKVATNTVMFVIGNTTAAAVRARCSNKILIADNPGKEYVLDQVIEYFACE